MVEPIPPLILSSSNSDDRMDDEMGDGFETAVGEITVAVLHRIRRTIMKTKMKIQ